MFISCLTEFIKKKKFAVDVTLDPDSAHPQLILSADGKQVTHVDTRQDLPDSPQRFNFPCVVGKQSFSTGRFYYEVQVRGKTAWTLGVVRENINRKGWMTANPQNGFWMVDLKNENQYRACACPDVPLTLREKVEVVRVFVDYEEGLVSFYDVKARFHIYSFTGQSFDEKLYPYFSPCNNKRACEMDCSNYSKEMKFLCMSLLLVFSFMGSQADTCIILCKTSNVFFHNTERLKVVGPDAPVFAVAGEDLVLPCFIKPSASAVEMRVEWFRLDAEDSLVHLYKDQKDNTEKQAQSYRGRTSLFKEELQKGNASLKLSALRFSDEGEYKCLVEDKSWYDDITVNVTVK
ncbi:hypothetical protein QTP86_021625, partial [Hemibagrus guttatus]